MKIGSEEHKEFFCRNFLATHRQYNPEQLPWPELTGADLDKLRAIPFWDEALYTERKAGLMLRTYAETVSDPLLRQAITLQADEEARHGRLIEYLIQRYDVKVPKRPESPLPDDLERGFRKFGYGECFDSFFAFGLFAIAREAQAMPEALFTIFDPILDEEARHMVFFVNWIAYRRITEGRGVMHGLASLWNYADALRRRLDTLKSSGQKQGQKKGFTATGAKSFMAHLTLEKFLATCVQENISRMSVYDTQLLRPEVLPIVTSIVVQGLRLLPSRKADPAVSPS